MEVVTHKLMNFGYRISFQNLDKGNFENFGALGYSVNIAQFSKKLSSALDSSIDLFFIL